MSEDVFETYQVADMADLFEIDVLEETLENDSICSRLSESEEAVLRFIINNPNTQFVKLENTFRMSSPYVIRLVQEYGTTSKTAEKMEHLLNDVRQAN